MKGLRTVLSKVEVALLRRSKDLPQIIPKVVAISTSKPPLSIVQAYENGQRHFSENLLEEILYKASDPQILKYCRNIKWHFTGFIRTDQVNDLLSCPGLFMVDTLNSKKLANDLNKKWTKIGNNIRNLNVKINVNTGTQGNNGIEPTRIIKMFEHVNQNCPNLQLDGIISTNLKELTSNDSYIEITQLSKCRQNICEKLNLDINNFDISMKPYDYEHAIESGVTTVYLSEEVFGKNTTQYKNNIIHHVFL